MTKTIGPRPRSPGSLAGAVLVALAAAPAELAAQNRAADSSGLEEIVVTATRVATDLQKTPASVAVLTGEQMALRGIDAGRDLGIMIPNVVINPGAGELAASIRVRGLPGVTTYVDGVWTENLGILQRSFVETERVEVLRGPQGTLFGRNANGGAIHIITRAPADEFGIRLAADIGSYDRRAASVSVDAPLSDRVLTKWTLATDRNDGFIESRSGDFAYGDQDNRLMRADVVWRATDRLSLRFNVNREDRDGSPARLVRISNTAHPAYIAYNVLAGNPDFLARARAIDPNFPNPPATLRTDRFTPETHESGFPGGQLGRWEMRSDVYSPTEVDQVLAVVKLDWRLGDRWSLESSTARVETDLLQFIHYDGSELDSSTDLVREDAAWTTQEVHLVGEHFNGRLSTFLGFYYHDTELWSRGQSWWFWEFATPNSGPSPPPVNAAALNYVRSWGALVGNPVATFTPAIGDSVDRLFYTADTDRALFGQLTVAALDKLDVTLGFRYTTDDGRNDEYVPADSFRPPVPGAVASGNPFAPAAPIRLAERPDYGTVSTPKISVSYEVSDTVFVYGSYAEGFTSSATLIVSGTSYVLDPEIVNTHELGVRTTWLDRRLRMNATAFSSEWDGLRVNKFPPDPNNPGQLLPIAIPSSDGLGASDGLELELAYVPSDRWQLDLALGLLDTEYLDLGAPPANGTGLQPGIPFAYAPEKSYSLALNHLMPLASGNVSLAVSYGWMDEYQRVPGNQFQTKNADGNDNPEPAYGVLNARIGFAPARGRWEVSAFGTNLTDEWYVNGGFDLRLFQGFDFVTVGRRREVGVGFRYAID